MTIALVLLLTAATLGAWLAIASLTGGRPASAWMTGLIHAAFGATGLLELAIALHRHPLRAGAGIAGFGRAAEILLLLTVLFGLIVIVPKRRGWSNLAIGIHSTLAIAAITLVATIATLG